MCEKVLNVNSTIEKNGTHVGPGTDTLTIDDAQCEWTLSSGRSRISRREGASLMGGVGVPTLDAAMFRKILYVKTKESGNASGMPLWIRHCLARI